MEEVYKLIRTRSRRVTFPHLPTLPSNYRIQLRQQAFSIHGL